MCNGQITRSLYPEHLLVQPLKRTSSMQGRHTNTIKKKKKNKYMLKEIHTMHLFICTNTIKKRRKIQVQRNWSRITYVTGQYHIHHVHYLHISILTHQSHVSQVLQNISQSLINITSERHLALNPILPIVWVCHAAQPL